MIKVTCEQCGGAGWVPLEEDGHDVQHACYRCGTDGYHEYTEQQYCDMVNELVAEVTAKRQ